MRACVYAHVETGKMCIENSQNPSPPLYRGGTGFSILHLADMAHSSNIKPFHNYISHEYMKTYML